MAGTKRTEITIETHRITIVRRQGAVRSCCPGCGQEAEFVSGEEAATIVPLLSPTADPGHLVHRLRCRDGAVLVCLTSLVNSSANPKPKTNE